MSGYPDANYAPAPEYPSTVGTSCQDPAPARFWEGGTFCTDVTIIGNLNTGTLNVLTEPVTVAGTIYQRRLIVDLLGNSWYVLAAAAPSPVLPFPWPPSPPSTN
jgi:hypothetical protein